MRTIVLDGGLMPDQETAHAYLARRLSFPDWYGRNLDALYDLLTQPMAPTRLVLYRRPELEAALGPYARSLLAVLADAAGENPDLEMCLDEE